MGACLRPLASLPEKQIDFLYQRKRAPTVAGAQFPKAGGLLCGQQIKPSHGLLGNTLSETLIAEAQHTDVQARAEKTARHGESMDETALDGCKYLILGPAVVAIARVADLLGLTNELVEAGLILEIGEDQWLAVIVLPHVPTLGELHPRLFNAGQPALRVSNVVERPRRSVSAGVVHVVVADASHDHVLHAAVVREVYPHLVLFPELGLWKFAETNLLRLKPAIGITQDGVAPLLLCLVGHGDARIAGDDTTIREPDRHRASAVVDTRLMYEEWHTWLIRDRITEATDDSLGTVRHQVVGVRPGPGLGVDLEDNLVTDFE